MGEPDVVRRLAAPGIAAFVLLSSSVGLRGLASLLLLAAIVACGARLVEVVGLAAEGRGERVAVVMSAAGLASLVAAGATHVVWLVGVPLVCAAVELLDRSEAAVELPVETVELRRAA